MRRSPASGQRRAPGRAMHWPLPPATPANPRPRSRRTGSTRSRERPSWEASMRVYVGPHTRRRVGKRRRRKPLQSLPAGRSRGRLSKKPTQHLPIMNTARFGAYAAAFGLTPTAWRSGRRRLRGGGRRPARTGPRRLGTLRAAWRRRAVRASAPGGRPPSSPAIYARIVPRR